MRARGTIEDIRVTMEQFLVVWGERLERFAGNPCHGDLMLHGTPDGGSSAFEDTRIIRPKNETERKCWSGDQSRVEKALPEDALGGAGAKYREIRGW